MRNFEKTVNQKKKHLQLKEKIIIKNKAKKEVKKIKKEIELDLSLSKNVIERRNLKNEAYKKYISVYILYGQYAYLKTVPKGIRKKDLKDLYYEGKFLDIYDRHGEDVFKKLETEIMAQDIIYESGSTTRGELFEFRKKLTIMFKRAVAVVTGLAIGGNLFVLTNSEKNRESSIKENAKEISEYLNFIDEYAENIKKLNLTDTELIMKVMYDTWDNIDGYGEPEKDVLGCLGLDMFGNNGVGVCRNIADDFARKLNAIDEKYNARVIVVDAKINYDEVEIANIERSKVSSEEIEENQDKDNKNISLSNILIGVLYGFVKKSSGNHAVVLIDVPEDNITLIIDPTNPAIGVYKDGQIRMFNSKTEKGYILERRFLGEEILCGIDSYKLPVEYLKSFLTCKLSNEELEKKYGVEAQNTAVEKFKSKSNSIEFWRVIYDYYKEKGVNPERELEQLPKVKNNKEYER